jgi:acetylornithine deacetylase
MAGEQLSTQAMLARLVSFDTTSRNSNLALIDWVADYLAGHGIESQRVFNETGNKANLFATIGPKGDGGIVLSGHTDVVPVDNQDWASDPFTLTERDGAVYARGTADMKGFIACALAHVPNFTAQRLKRPIHFAWSYDEEVGCLGVGGLTRHLRETGLKPAAAIVGEPTMMSVVNTHKSGLVGTCTVRGRAGHSSQMHRNVNALMYAAELITYLQREQDRMKAGPLDDSFMPPFSTIQVNIAHSGTAHNITPDECKFYWECRMIPAADPQATLDGMRRYAETMVLPRMRAVWPECAVEIDTYARVPGLRADPGSAAETLALRLVGSNSVGAVSYGTEAGFFQEIEIPTVICGPGDITQAHKPDEFVAIEQLAACDRFMKKLAVECAQT